jgi:hypothetical protein
MGTVDLNMNDDAKYRESVQREINFRLELNAVKSAMSELQTQAPADGSRGLVAREADALVNGEDDSADVGREQLAALRHKAAVLEKAIELQRQVVARERARVSRLIAEQRLPEYKAIVKRGAKALADVRQFILDERDFRESLINADVSFTSVIRPMPFTSLTEDDCDRWTAEAKAYELI